LNDGEELNDQNKKDNIKLPLFNLSFGHKDNADFREEVAPKVTESTQLLPLNTLKLPEENLEQRYPFKVPTQHMCFSSSSSPYVAINWYGSPHTQSTALGGVPHSQGLVTSLSPLAVSPRMDTFGDFERVYTGRHFTFGESPINFCLPYINNSPSFQRSFAGQQPPSK
jgi:hypothetical protein